MAAEPLLLPKDCYSVGQLRRLLKLSRQAIHARRKRGTIAFIRFGGSYMFPKRQIDEGIQKANDEAYLP